MLILYGHGPRRIRPNSAPSWSQIRGCVPGVREWGYVELSPPDGRIGWRGHPHAGRRPRVSPILRSALRSLMPALSATGGAAIVLAVRRRPPARDGPAARAGAGAPLRAAAAGSGDTAARPGARGTIRGPVCAGEWRAVCASGG